MEKLKVAAPDKKPIPFANLKIAEVLGVNILDEIKKNLGGSAFEPFSNIKHWDFFGETVYNIEIKIKDPVLSKVINKSECRVRLPKDFGNMISKLQVFKIACDMRLYKSSDGSHMSPDMEFVINIDVKLPKYKIV